MSKKWNFLSSGAFRWLPLVSVTSLFLSLAFEMIRFILVDNDRPPALGVALFLATLGSILVAAYVLPRAETGQQDPSPGRLPAGLGQDLLDSAPLCAAVLDGQGVILATNWRWKLAAQQAEANPAQGASLGKDYPALCAKTGLAAGLPEDLRDLLAGGRDELVRELTCGERWYRVSAWTVCHPVRYTFLTLFDVTPGVRQRTALEQSEARYRAVFNACPDPLFLSAADGALLEANPAGLALLGCDPAGLGELTLAQIAFRDDPPGAGSLAQVTFRPPGAAEASGPYELHSAVIDEGGAQPYQLTVARDVRRRQLYTAYLERRGRQYCAELDGERTERCKAEEALRKEEKKLRSIIQQSHDGIFVIDEKGHVLEWNQGQERITGIPHAAAAGALIWEVFERLDLRTATVFANMQRVERDQKELFLRLLTQRPPAEADKQIEFEMDSLDGIHRCVQTNLFSIHVDQVVFWGGISRDISDFRRRERAFHESEKLIATGQMASRIAHEINNPLAGIRSAFLLLKKGIPEDYRYYRYVGRMEAEIDRIARIVRQMFELYRPVEKGNQIALRATVEDVLAMLECRSRQRRVQVTLGAWEVPEKVTLAADSLRQILYNLVVNAIEASPPGGVVRISATVQAGRLTLSIRDQGEGIPAAMREKIYEPFFSTKKEFPGSGLGLGLPVSKNLAEAMGGNIVFESRPGEGTTFFVTLPLTENLPAAGGSGYEACTGEGNRPAV